MRNPTVLVRLTVLAAALLAVSSCSILCKKKATLRGTAWVAEDLEFVADVGTATLTYRLVFSSDKEFTMATEFYMPAHPATYVNPDGTIDRIDASSSRYESSGTYRYNGKTLTLTLSDGYPMDLTREGDSFVTETRFGEMLVFTKDE